MRTKTLLIAGAALALSLATSQAQNIYSANIVGYTTTVIPGGTYSMLANTLNDDTNGVSEIFNNTCLSPSGGETLYIWNGTGYYIYYYEGAGVGTGLGFLSDWADGSYSPPASLVHNIPNEVYDSGDDIYWTPIPTRAPGQGFFMYNPNGNETNIFQGSMNLSNNVAIPGGAYSQLSSPIPYAGNITKDSINLTANFSPSGGETLYIWNGTGYYIYYYEGAGTGTGLGEPSDWADGSYSPPASLVHNIPGEVYDSTDDIWWTLPLTNHIGQGFFMYNPNGTENWIQVFNNNN